MEKSFYDHCMENNAPHILAQWDAESNGDLTPHSVSYGSRKKVWWRCEKGHEWQTEVRIRSRGDACPVCLGKTVLPGFNDLATSYPRVAAQWHFTKNDDLTPDKVMAGTHRKVWWRCEKGHEWQARVDLRAQGAGCPVCAGKIIVPGENDLQSQRPEIAAQWHPELNGDLTPQSVGVSSNRNAWWICGLGHEFEARVADMTRGGRGCPYCSGRRLLVGFNDLATVYPKIAAQWHPELNGDLTPEMVQSCANKKAWWRCDNGHVWHAYISSRTSKRKHGCPVCSGKVKESRQNRYAYIMAERQKTNK